MKKMIWSIMTLALVAAVAVGCASQPPKPTEVPSVTAEAAQATVASPTEVPTLAPTPVPTPAPTPTAATASAAPAANVTEGQLSLTLAQLAEYNGKDGKPAYIAVDGVIYDVTNVPTWKNGAHEGYAAGQDLTEAIKTKSPHGVSKLEGVPVVGKLVP